MQYNYVDLQNTCTCKLHFNIIMLHVDIIMLHVSISMLHADMNKLHVTIIMLHVDIWFILDVGGGGQKYASMGTEHLTSLLSS